MAPFAERLIGTIDTEHLDRILFWTPADPEAERADFQHYYNGHRTHAGLEGRLPEQGAGEAVSPAGMGWALTQWAARELDRKIQDFAKHRGRQ